MSDINFNVTDPSDSEDEARLVINVDDPLDENLSNRNLRNPEDNGTNQPITGGYNGRAMGISALDLAAKEAINVAETATRIASIEEPNNTLPTSFNEMESNGNMSFEGQANSKGVQGLGFPAGGAPQVSDGQRKEVGHVGGTGSPFFSSPGCVTPGRVTPAYPESGIIDGAGAYAHMMQSAHMYAAVQYAAQARAVQTFSAFSRPLPVGYGEQDGTPTNGNKQESNTSGNHGVSEEKETPRQLATNKNSKSNGNGGKKKDQPDSSGIGDALMLEGQGQGELLLNRGHRRRVPEEEKDEAYRTKRMKNNESAKRSRNARKQKEVEISHRLRMLEDENKRLHEDLNALKPEVERLREIAYRN